MCRAALNWMNSGVSAFPAACCGVSERIRSCSFLKNRDSLQLSAGRFNIAPAGGIQCARFFAVYPAKRARPVPAAATGPAVRGSARLRAQQCDKADLRSCPAFFPLTTPQLTWYCTRLVTGLHTYQEAEKCTQSSRRGASSTRCRPETW